jgi:hypothetical protein
MSTYKELLNTEIKTLLKEINAPLSLEKNIIDTLLNTGRTGIFKNQIINALRIGISLKEGNQNMAFLASMQSGKSGTIYFLCNYVMPAIGLIRKYESILFITSMRDTDLYDQNCRVLQREYYDAYSNKMMPSKLKVMKMSNFFNRPNPHKVVNDFNVQLIIRDEDQYGCGEESSFQVAFFNELRRRISDIKLLAVSATPYDILDAQFNGDADVDVIVGVRPKEYYGITEMIRDGLIENIPNDFKPLQSQKIEGETVYSVHPKVEQYVNHLNIFDDGLGVIRESNSNRAAELRELLLKKYKKTCKVILIGSNSICDFSINEGIKEVSDLILRRGQRVVLIIVQALTAGKDLGMLKEKVRFGIEPRNKQLANGAQGIIGRFCGYHKNRNIKIMASLELLNHYSKFEQDWEIFVDPQWRNDLFNAKVRGLSTQTKFVKNQSQGIFTPIENIEFIPYEELITKEGRNKLQFIDEDAYSRLLSVFEPTVFNEDTKGMKFNQKGVTFRVSSSYNQNSNRVYKNWNCNLKSDFGSVFFKKNQYNYGILVSNYPNDDSRNKIGVSGLKIITSGKREWRSQVTLIENDSMYSLSRVA